MIEMLKMCWQWVSENYKEVAAFLMSAQFASLVGTLVLVFRSKKKTEANIVSSDQLTATLNKTNDGLVKVDNIDEQLAAANAKVDRLESELAKAKESNAESFNALLTKINAMLEIQSVVYSTIKNDTVRDTVNNLITNAKYVETTTRAKLKQEIEELKKKVETRVNDVMEDVTKAAEVIESAVTASDDTVLRY